MSVDSVNFDDYEVLGLSALSVSCAEMKKELNKMGSCALGVTAHVSALTVALIAGGTVAILTVLVFAMVFAEK